MTPQETFQLCQLTAKKRCVILTLQQMRMRRYEDFTGLNFAAANFLSLKEVSPYIRAKFRMLLNKGNISREHSERISFATA